MTWAGFEPGQWVVSGLTSDVDPTEASFFGVLSGPMVRRVMESLARRMVDPKHGSAAGMGSNPAPGLKI